MKIAEIHSKENWENFLKLTNPHSFLHAWSWGEVQEKLGTKIIRLGIYDEGELVAVALVLRTEARRGSFLFCPHGPVIRSKTQTESVLQVLTEELKERGRKLGYHFIRISSLLPNSQDSRSIFRRMGFREAPIHLMHPERAWMLDLTKETGTLLKEMRKTTRYLIRKAEKAGVVVKEGTSDEYLEQFLSIYRKTVERQRFTPFKDELLRIELEVFRRNDAVQIFLAEYNGQTIAAALVIFWGGSAFYHHGASDHDYSQIPGPYLLQWRVIEEAKRRGLVLYNFWGVVRPEETKHPWAGLSLFKTGFGGFAEEYLHAQDLILSPGYWLSWLVETVRKKKRGF